MTKVRPDGPINEKSGAVVSSPQKSSSARDPTFAFTVAYTRVTGGIGG
jgi:hypothetical protein